MGLRTASAYDASPRDGEVGLIVDWVNCNNTYVEDVGRSHRALQAQVFTEPCREERGAFQLGHPTQIKMEEMLRLIVVLRWHARAEEYMSASDIEQAVYRHFIRRRR